MSWGIRPPVLKLVHIVILTFPVSLSDVVCSLRGICCSARVAQRQRSFSPLAAGDDVIIATAASDYLGDESPDVWEQ